MEFVSFFCDLGCARTQLGGFLPADDGERMDHCLKRGNVQPRLVTFMTCGILFERAGINELPSGYYYAHVPALGLTTHGEGIEGARAAAKELVTLWLSEKKAAGESFGLPSEFFFSTIEISESALQSA